jgi:Tricorn protease C1 domain
MPHRSALVFSVMLALRAAMIFQAQQPIAAQLAPGAISKYDRERALSILENVAKGIQNLYYDPKMNGLDWNAVIARARVKIVASNSLNEALTQIAGAVSALNHSHTLFRPPRAALLPGFWVPTPNDLEPVFRHAGTARVRRRSERAQAGRRNPDDQWNRSQPSESLEH